MKLFALKPSFDYGIKYDVTIHPDLAEAAKKAAWWGVVLGGSAAMATAIVLDAKATDDSKK